MAKFNSRDTANYTENSETYFIIGSGNPAIVAAWVEHFRKNNIGNRRVLGTYDGANEVSFVVNARDFGKVRAILGGQESVLVLGPMASATAFRPAMLHYMSGTRLPLALGFFEPLDDDEAESFEGDYTLDGDTKYVCRF